ncbi:MAG: type II secretion system protein GspG [Abditibacteriales bacterium]|nr:type II secretion system protein GspG [Abditibacteriales bacterium]MDW8366258.1 type II secretion system protein GspG [Abditibacteriales bacterium]
MTRRKIIISIVAVACGGIVFALYHFISEPFRLLRREVALIRQDGDPAEWSEILAALPTVRDNAAPIYQQAFALLDEGTPAEKDAFSHFMRLNPQDHLKADLQAVRRLLAKNRKALALVRQAAQKPAVQFDVDWSDPLKAQLPHYAPLRYCVRLLRAEGRLQKEAGDVEGGIATMRSALRIAKQIESEHPQQVIGMLVRCALSAIALQGFQEILTDADASPQTYRALLQDLNGHDIKPTLIQAFRTDRCTTRFAFDLMRSGQAAEYASSSGDRAPRPRSLAFNPPALWWLAHEETFCLRLWRRLIQMSRQPGYDWQAFTVVEREAHQRFAFFALSRQLMPTFVRAYKKAAGVQARVDLLRLALALRLYRHDHGAYPANLNALQPQYLPAVPLDPFTNKPFVYRREGSGFLLYSFGENHRDDGGAFDPKLTPRDDVVWRSKR